MKIPRARVIVNPAAGANSTRKKWPELNRLLNSIGLVFDSTYTEGAGHAIELAREAAGDGYEYLVSVGGDGTVNEVANGIMHSGGADRVSLGVVSTGTGSDFVRSLGLPAQYQDACSLLVSPRRSRIDVGRVEFHNNGNTSSRFFVNVAGVGFDAAATAATEKMPKRLGGTIPYLAGLFRTLITYRNKSVVLSVGDRVENARVLSVIVGNGNYIGGGMNVTPFASPTDGFLDICVIGDINKFNLIKSLPMLYNGTINDHPKVTMDRSDRVTVESTDKFLVHADGEVLGEGPASFTIFPAALSIVVK
jgi:YegS/Rv2252/BmrU family lipid kinase